MRICGKRTGNEKALMQPRRPMVSRFPADRIAAAAAAFGLTLVLSIAAQAHGGEWRILPMGLELNKNVRSGVFTVINDGSEAATFQVSAVDWSQDPSGKEVYGPTKEIVFFPRIVTIAPGAQQVIRVGYQGPAPLKEKTFRLFIKEIPSGSRRDPEVRMRVAVTMQFATPIFVTPQRKQTVGNIGGLSHAGGKLLVTVLNKGNTHFRIDSMTVRGTGKDGAEVFSREVKGWYVLHDAQAVYPVPLPFEECGRTTVFEITASGDAISLKETVKVENSICSP